MTDLTIFENAQLPAHLAEAFGSDADDLSSGVRTGYPILSYKGKTWHLVQGGARTLIANADGDPRMSLELVILKSNPAISKIYYEGGYVEGSTDKPTCYSTGGVIPEPDSEKRQAEKCAICPHNQWGSRISENGAKGKACSDTRRLAVAPAGQLDNPMLLRVPAGSLKELVAYANLLKSRKAPYQAVVTKVAFDTSVAHQKFLFSPVRFLTEAEMTNALEASKSELVAQIAGLQPEPVADSTPPAHDPLGATPAHVVQAAQQSEERKSAAHAQLKVSEADVAEVLGEEPKPAITADVFGGGGDATPAPAKAQAKPVPEERQAVLLDNAASALAEALASLDD